MSTGLNCTYYEVEPGKWYYVLERWDAPKMAWDWREFADCVGPFETEDAAHEHLHDNHANPGGSATLRYRKDLRADAKPDETLAKLVANATAPTTRGARGWSS